MQKSIFVNLPVGNVAAASAFYKALGFDRNAGFSNDRASAMVWSDTISVMLLDHDFYASFTDKRIIDPKTESGVLLCLSFDSREAVDQIHQRAIAAGGTETRARQQQGPMYGGAFEDPDGHVWETVFLDMTAMKGSGGDA
ncbi:VOC family protein [Palleronia sp. LCG004]|uniref:VOC family protein n=1 Tax=Palleronia sp. LCG004 TaxID=3079304 RepID=UPI002942093C|nr:VOC family protein [Palleronia sp. LCG004]WOI56408.1 VOC family protein [Palleronia sp. LCG004]